MATSSSLEKANLNSSVSETQLYQHLRSELEKRNDLVQTNRKINQTEVDRNPIRSSEYNMIYRFKLEKSRGDSIFSSVNDTQKVVGSTLGLRTNSYLEGVRRFQASHELVSEATHYQRNLIRNFTNCALRMVSRNKTNYLLKTGLASMFLYNLFKANENANLYRLRKHHPSRVEVARFYYNTAVSFVFAFGAFALI